MFFDIGPLELVALIVLAVLVFGPEKLPKVIQDVAAFIRKVRQFSDSAKEDIRSELGPEFKDFEFEDLNPKNFARKHLMDNDELGIKELSSSFDLRKDLAEVTDAVNGKESGNSSGDADGARPSLSKNGSDGRSSAAGGSSGKADTVKKADMVKEAGPGGRREASETDGAAATAEPAPAALRKSDPPPFDADAT
ncbi:sec-independent translocase [Streptomyces sp. NBC_01775]|uniref:sec-independent translocase n=1 Tax=Streptomyces sp. NBC_01775 TaxID=2975939 RepID=UPI002DDBE5B1|nr:sec-independent translocase [Streptomyces sp. NBC_01775]WSB76892.1 sec-independent translocase [Streptomyces sp. NBC_01775]